MNKQQLLLIATLLISHKNYTMLDEIKDAFETVLQDISRCAHDIKTKLSKLDQECESLFDHISSDSSRLNAVNKLENNHIKRLVSKHFTDWKNFTAHKQIQCQKKRQIYLEKKYIALWKRYALKKKQENILEEGWIFIPRTSD